MASFAWEQNYPTHLDWKKKYAGKPLGDIFDATAKKIPNQRAVNFMEKTYTYGDLDLEIQKAATGFQKMGVVKGDRVGLMLPNVPYYPILYFALLKLGAVVVNFNPLYAEQEVKALINLVGLKIMATVDLIPIYTNLENRLEDTTLETILLCPFKDVLPFPKSLLFPLLKRKNIAKPKASSPIVTYKELTAKGTDFTKASIDPENDLAVIQFTGGTTGIPKGAMLSHANISVNCQQVADWFPEIEFGKAKIVAVLPFFHVFAMTGCLNFPILTGMEVVMLPRFELDDCMATIHKHKPDVFAGVPTIYTAFNNDGGLGTKYDFSTIKYAISGGAGLPQEVKRKFEDMSSAKIVEAYGLSETSPGATFNPPVGDLPDGSIGLPLASTTIDIIAFEPILDEAGKTLFNPGDILPAGHEHKGEICISGPQVMMGYWQREDATNESIRDGRFHTGDIGHQDSNGFTFIVDRLKEMILASGFNVYPRNVEEALYQNPKIAEAAVLGVPDDYRGQTVKACIVLQPGESLTEQELDLFLDDKITSYEQPKIYEFREELPKSQVGKILKRVLLDEHVAATKS